jgi:hypothetical protein
MSVLHDHPVLGQGEISVALPGNDLGEQFERLRITPLPMPLEEMSKLWMVFQTQYRISAAYEVTVLLIDSRAPVKAPLPVLQRGEGDRGVATTTGVAPSLHEIRAPASQPAARLGEDVTIAGAQLTAADATVRFSSARLAQPIELGAASGAQPGELAVHLPDKTEDPTALARWVPGYYTVALVVKKAGAPAVVSNEIVFALAPRITVTPRNAARGTVTLTLTCGPRIRAGQPVLLLFGDRQLQPDSISNPVDTTQPTSLVFTVQGVAANGYVVRLRVDGVDSIPVVQSGTPPVPTFDPLQKVTVA